MPRLAAGTGGRYLPGGWERGLEWGLQPLRTTVEWPGTDGILYRVAEVTRAPLQQCVPCVQEGPQQNQGTPGLEDHLAILLTEVTCSNAGLRRSPAVRFVDFCTCAF